MKPIVSGIVVGVLVFFVLLMVFAFGTGPVELVLWLVLAVASGVLTTVLVARRGRAES